MRIDEILSSNQIIINLTKMKIEFRKEFEFIRESHLFFIQNHIGIARHRRLLSNIENLQLGMEPFLSYDFDADLDIDQLKSEARSIILELDKIKKQIP